MIIKMKKMKMYLPYQILAHLHLKIKVDLRSSKVQALPVHIAKMMQTLKITGNPPTVKTSISSDNKVEPRSTMKVMAEG
jgi:hypothetical protein